MKVYINNKEKKLKETYYNWCYTILKLKILEGKMIGK